MTWYTGLAKRVFELDLTIKCYLTLGLFWTLAGLLLSVLSEAMFFIPALVPGILDYGHLKPISSLALIFGAFLSLVLGTAYYVLNTQARLEGPLALSAFICMKLHHIGLLLGIIAVLLGFNKGRSFGEMPWLADDIFIPAFLGFPVLALIALRLAAKETKTTRAPLLLLLTAVAGGLIYYVLGNFNLPSGWLHSTPLFTGIQDTALQELYQSGLLFFVIVASLLGLLYYFIPLYYKTELYSNSIPFFVLIALLLLTPLSAATGLVYTTASPWLQSVGIFCSMALNFAILAGGLNANYSITRFAKQYRSDAIGLMLRTGIFFLLLYALMRALLAPRFMQAWSTFTALSSGDLSLDLKTYGLMIALPIALIVLQMITTRTWSRGVLRWLASFWLIGAALLYLGNLATGITEYLGSSAFADPDGQELALKDWESIFFKGSLINGDSLTIRYLMSFRGLAFTGELLLVLGTALLVFYAALRGLWRPKSASLYQLPELEVSAKEKIASTSEATGSY